MKANSKNLRIGFDLGNTIIQVINGHRAPFPECTRVVKLLVQKFGKENSFIVSKVNEEQELRARKWLTNSGFCTETDLDFVNVYFCRERHEKGPICHELDITHFIDDRPEVLAHMTSVQNRILFNGDEIDLERFKEKLIGVIKVSNWLEIEEILL